MNNMIINKHFSSFIFKYAGKDIRAIYISTVLNGLCLALMMYSLTLGLGDYSEAKTVSVRGLILFAVSLILYYITQEWGSRVVSMATTQGLGELEVNIVDKLRRTDYATFSAMDKELIYSVVGGDKYGVIVAARFLIPTMSSCIVVVIIGLYLLTVSVVGAIVVGGTLTALIIVRNKLDVNNAKRKAEDDKAADTFTVSIKDIVDGFNELKINRTKSEAIFEKKVIPAAKTKGESVLRTEIFRMKSLVLEQASLFIPLGLILFVVPLFFEIEAGALVRIISVTLLVIWPAYSLVQFGPASAAASGIIERLEKLDAALDEANLDPEIENDDELPAAPEFSKINCNVTFEYPLRPGDVERFKVEITDFYINKGEMIFMQGGNGSGKSTFMRIFSGLEEGFKGSITVDGTSIIEIGRANYRSLFSLIMADFHLFDGFYRNDAVNRELFYKWVQILELSEKVKTEKKLPTVQLSSGQKKRMALLAAIMEDRPILLFDEVAADFDPHFREKYYREILPQLKAEGRTIFVISHDDRYFDMADRVMTMREGRLDNGH